METFAAKRRPKGANTAKAPIFGHSMLTTNLHMQLVVDATPLSLRRLYGYNKLIAADLRIVQRCCITDMIIVVVD